MKRLLIFRTWNGEQMVSPDYIDRNGLAWWKENSIPTTSDKVMQFIGIYDKNESRIFEGDKVRCVGGTNYQGVWEHAISGVIRFSSSASFDVVTPEGVHYSFGYSDFEEIEIIGHIYETTTINHD